MYSNFILISILFVINLTTSILFTINSFLFIVKNKKTIKPSCIYYLFATLFYLIYVISSYLNYFKFNSNLIYLIPSSSNILLIVFVMFLFLFEGNYLQEEVENRKTSPKSKTVTCRQKQLKVTEIITQLLMYTMLLQLFLIVSLNTVLQEAKLLFPLVNTITFTLLIFYSICITRMLSVNKLIGYSLIGFGVISLLESVLKYTLQDFTILFVIRNQDIRNIIRAILMSLFIVLNIAKNITILMLIKTKLKGKI